MSDKRFKKHPYDPGQVKRSFEGALRKLRTAEKIAYDDREAAYQLAYEAMLKGSIGLIMRHGMRVRSIPGHHLAIIEMSQKIIGEKISPIMDLFEYMRRNRHSFLYDDISDISEPELKETLDVAKKYLDIIKEHLKL